jgi:hypothetical protein
MRCAAAELARERQRDAARAQVELCVIEDQLVTLAIL